VQCNGELKASIKAAVSAIGGFERIVSPGDDVFVKPNLNTDDPPPGSSDPAFVKSVVELLFEGGAASVTVADCATISMSTSKVLRNTGVGEAARRAGARVVDLSRGKFLAVDIFGRYLKQVHLAGEALEAQKIVYLSCLKTHRLASFTMSLKLSMGLVRPRDRMWMHLRRLEEKVAELNTAVSPDLVIMDGRVCFISGGPGRGEIREPDVVMASGNRVAIDVEGIKVLQQYPECSLDKDPWGYPQIRRAVELGLGPGREDGYRTVEVEPVSIEGQIDG
jgi:uncharacterized protein (DUF362 family)